MSERFVSAAYQAESRRIMRMLRDGPPPDREPQARIILPMSADGLRAVLSALPDDAQVYDGVEGRELWVYWGRNDMIEQLIPERLDKFRRIAKAATPGPWAVNPFKATVDEMPSMLPICGLLWPTDQRTEEQTLANATHIATFDPTTVIAILDEIERLRRKRETLVAAVMAQRERNEHIAECEQCDYELCPVGGELSYRAKRMLDAAISLLDGEQGGGGA